MKVSVDTVKHIKRRERLAKSLGMQAGTMYAKHIEKFNHSRGYVRDGNLRHYVSCNCKRRIHVKGRRDER